MSDVNGSPPLLLLGNDQEWSLRSLESVLGPRGFATVRAYTGQRVLELSRTTRFDAIVLSRSLSDLSGLAVLSALRHEPTFSPAVPVILLTTETPTRAERLDAYRAGAWEFLSEPYDVEALVLKLELFVRAKRERDRTAESGLVDDLTGLYSAKGLARRARELGADISRRRAVTTCVVLTAEIDGDGEPRAGDDLDAALATHLANLCRQVFRTSDVIARLGRSELVLLLPDTDGPASQGALGRLANVLADRPLINGSASHPVTIRHAVREVKGSDAALDLVSEVLASASALRQERAPVMRFGAA